MKTEQQKIFFEHGTNKGKKIKGLNYNKSELQKFIIYFL